MKTTISKVWDYKKGTQCCIKHHKYPDEAMKQMKKIDIKFGGRPLSRYDWYCGYVAFPGLTTEMKSELELDNISVHGGPTYLNQQEGALVIGFDCNHAGDVDRPEVEDIDWLTKETEQMADQLIEFFNYQGQVLLEEAN